MKRFKLADLVLVVAMGAVTAYFVRTGDELYRRGFITVEIAIAIGLPVAIDIATCWLVLILNAAPADGPVYEAHGRAVSRRWRECAAHGQGIVSKQFCVCDLTTEGRLKAKGDQFFEPSLSQLF